MTPFMMGTTSSITMQSLGKIVQRAPAVVAKTWCLYVFLFLVILSRSEAGALFVRGVHSSNKHCVADYWQISMWFSAFFSEVIALSETLHSSHFRR